MRARELLLAEWERLDFGNKLDLLWRSTSAFWDALWLQPWRLEDEMIQDLRYGARVLVRDKGFTVAAVLTLALGIGANTAIFSVTSGVLLKSLPFPEAGRLLVLHEASKTNQVPVISISYPNLRDWQQQQTVFEDIAAYLPVSMVLVGAGGVLGTMIAVWGVRLLLKLDPGSLPRLHEVAIDSRALGFTLVISLLAAVIFGLVPAPQTARTDVHETLKDGGRNQEGSGRKLRGALVVVEVALALMLLIGAGLLLRSFQQVMKVDLGFDPQNVLTMRVRLPEAKYDKAEKVLSFHEETLRRVKSLPGVLHASITNRFPLGNAITFEYRVEGQPPPPPGEGQKCIIESVSPAYHQVFGIGLLAGRYFAPQDNAGTPPVVIVDEAFARRHFAGLALSQVIGKRVLVGGDNLPWREIVGVMRHVRHFGREEEGWPEIYRLWSQMGEGWIARRMHAMDLAVKTAADPLGFVASIRREIQAIDKEQPLGNLRTIESLLDESTDARRFTLLLLALFALMSLLLGAVGIYGVIAYSVAQRARELGIRLALGAESRDLLKLIVGQGLKLVFAGIAVGLAGAFALTRFVASLLFEVSATDPVTFACIPLLLSAVTLLACWVPARRATKVDPLRALRHE